MSKFRSQHPVDEFKCKRTPIHSSAAGPTPDWISPLLAISWGLASAGSCIPFPYVNTAFAGGVALLELIETVGKMTDNILRSLWSPQ
ncbi:hypothetical protein C8R44DRAFT_876864 [Mycena epipterygia]|nr:hypothetical protein C8R44DRAFT_876864 [Mycena epipterygia]